MFSVNTYAAIKSDLKLDELEFVSIDLIQDIWVDRTALPIQPFFIFDAKYTGKSTIEKLFMVRAEMKKTHAQAFAITALDDIAWLFNIRGKDVDYNPVVIAYGLIEENKATLFVDSKKVTSETHKYLQDQGIALESYLAIYEKLKQIKPTKAILIDGAKLNQSLFEAIPATCTIRNTMSPVFKLKGIKNEVELNGVRKAMIKDGVALVQFFKWLEENVESEN